MRFRIRVEYYLKARSLVNTLMLDTANYKITSYYYDYHAKYGSDQFEKKSIQIQDVQVSEQGKQVCLTLDALEKNKIYEFHLSNFKAMDGDTLGKSLIYHTLNELQKRSKYDKVLFMNSALFIISN